MRRTILKLLAVAHCIVPTTSSAQNAELAALSWLAGCWAAEGRDAGSGEQWSQLAGGTMLGVGRTVRNGETVDYEFLQIRRNAEGKIVYIALPSGQTETSFVLTAATQDTFTFDNPQHDFPQRVIYRRMPEGRLWVRIEGNRDGAARGVDFPMQRAACEAR
jgi:hypothetical protein